MRTFLWLALFGTLGMAALCGAGAWWGWQELHTPLAPPTPEVVVTVPAGQSFRALTAQLRRAGVLRYPLVLRLWVRFHGGDRSVRHGAFRIRGPLTPLQLLELLQSPADAVRWVTIPEGRTTEDTAAILEAQGFGGRDAFLCATRDPHVLLDLDLPASGAEGYLFPDTYAFTWEMEPPAIVRAMVARFREQTQPLAERRRAAGMSEAAMVILASVIEKETGRADERPLISGVFHNRLRRGIPLQSDPTVIFGLRRFDRPLTRADLADPSPYNTYAHRGLPPGPIANPGRAALEAAVAPAATDALYFVSRNDGSHEFSATLAAHNRAVARYQRRQPARTAGPPH